MSDSSAGSGPGVVITTPHERATALVSRIAHGDQDALAELYDLTSPTLFGLALRIAGNKEDAEDILLEAYTKAWRIADRFDPARGAPLAWLLTMVRSISLDHLRANKRRGTESPSELVAIARHDPWQGDRISIQKALEELPEDQRTAIELAYFEGLTQTEIAARLNLPVGTVKTRVRLALAKLRTYMEGATIQ